MVHHPVRQSVMLIETGPWLHKILNRLSDFEVVLNSSIEMTVSFLWCGRHCGRSAPLKHHLFEDGCFDWGGGGGGEKSGTYEDLYGDVSARPILMVEGYHSITIRLTVKITVGLCVLLALKSVCCTNIESKSVNILLK